MLYGYDNAGKLTNVTERNAGPVGPGHDLRLQFDDRPADPAVLPNDTETLYSYDTAGNLTDMVHRRTSTPALIRDTTTRSTIQAGGPGS